MDSDLAGVIKIALISGTFLTAFIASLMVRRRPVARKDEQLAEVGRRLERIEQAVDSIAVEVERISEAQRFTSRLMAEKSGAPPQLPIKQVTPH